MTEKPLIVVSKDRKKIYCTLGVPKNKTDSVVIFVHGLASTELWPPMLLGSWFFRRKGFAYCRINLYDWRKDARTLMTSDLLTHSKDTDQVARRLKRMGYKKIYAVGHSFGGLTLLRVDHKLYSRISLWDISSFKKYPAKTWLKTQAKTGATYMHGAYELLLSERFKKGMFQFPNEHVLARKISTPTQICYADGPEGLLIDSSKEYFEQLTCEKELVGIPGASHSFTEEGKAEFLFRKTLGWFKK